MVWNYKKAIRSRWTKLRERLLLRSPFRCSQCGAVASPGFVYPEVKKQSSAMNLVWAVVNQSTYCLECVPAAHPGIQSNQPPATAFVHISRSNEDSLSHSVTDWTYWEHNQWNARGIAIPWTTIGISLSVLILVSAISLASLKILPGAIAQPLIITVSVALSMILARNVLAQIARSLRQSPRRQWLESQAATRWYRLGLVAVYSGLSVVMLIFAFLVYLW
jgi:hypothetical protein